MKGRDATVGCLLDAFERSGQKRIADNLLGMEIYFYRPRKWHVMIYEIQCVNNSLHFGTEITCCWHS